MNCWWIIICMIILYFFYVLLMEEIVWSCLGILTFECAHLWVCVCVCICDFGDWITEKWCVWIESETGCDLLFHMVCPSNKHLKCKWKEKREHRRKKTVGREEKGMVWNWKRICWYDIRTLNHSARKKKDLRF